MEENLFEESAALRLNRAVKEASNHLLSSPNGWIMEYFPTKDSSGITFLVNFRVDEWVTMATKNIYFPAYTEDSGMWKIIADQGSVLTFNTYDSIFHFFSDPHDIPQTPYNTITGEYFELGRGLEGDYEFVILSSTQDEVFLKGKKRATDIRLRRFSGTQDWPSYFQILDDVHSTLFSSKDIPLLRLRSDNVEYTLSNGLNHVFSADLKGGDPYAESKQIPFIITDYGIRFGQKFTIDSINNKKVQSFRLTEEKDRLISIDENINAEIIGPDLAALFQYVLKPGKNIAFSATSEKMSPRLIEVYNQINATCIADGGCRLNSVAFTNDRNGGTALFIATIKNGIRLTGLLSYAFASEQEAELSMQLNGLTESSEESLDFYNGYVYHKNYSPVRDFVQLLSGKFALTITQGSVWVPTAIKCTSLENPDVWFVLSTTI
jgi:hypothetical protein